MTQQAKTVLLLASDSKAEILRSAKSQAVDLEV